MVAFTVIIPARYASQRLPGKALIDIVGKPMIQRVYERASLSNARQVVVATDDERIADVVRGFGGAVCLTSALHPSGTDRLHEASVRLDLGPDHIVVNVQGDEPLIPPQVINQVAENLVTSGSPMATLYERIDDHADVLDPNIVKVVTDRQGLALYFSRAPMPFDRSQSTDVVAHSYKRHLGIYAYRVSLLEAFVAWPPCALEQTEKLEQLRALWHGVDIHVGESPVSIPPGIDTERDLARTRALLERHR
jgi:3-deoxy-manno-octulosonate cytidylyltransferase (CMP-KDO synthetase)